MQERRAAEPAVELSAAGLTALWLAGAGGRGVCVLLRARRPDRAIPAQGGVEQAQADQGVARALGCAAFPLRAPACLPMVGYVVAPGRGCDVAHAQWFWPTGICAC